MAPNVEKVENEEESMLLEGRRKGSSLPLFGVSLLPSLLLSSLSLSLSLSLSPCLSEYCGLAAEVVTGEAVVGRAALDNEPLLSFLRTGFDLGAIGWVDAGILPLTLPGSVLFFISDFALLPLPFPFPFPAAVPVPFSVPFFMLCAFSLDIIPE